MHPEEAAGGGTHRPQDSAHRAGEYRLRPGGEVPGVDPVGAGGGQHVVGRLCRRGRVRHRHPEFHAHAQRQITYFS